MVPYPVFNGPFDGQVPTAPPTPLWAWLPIHLSGRVVYAFPRAPLPPEHPSAIGPLEDRPTDPLITPSGEDRLATGGPANYWAFDISVPHVPDGSYTIRLGPMVLAEATVYAERVHSIQPNDVARKLGLWGCHIARVTSVYLRLHASDQPRPF